MRIFGDWHPVRARIETIEGFSAHADQRGLLEWFERMGGAPRRTFIVHGEEAASLALASRLEQRFAAEVHVPHPNQRFDLD